MGDFLSGCFLHRENTTDTLNTTPFSSRAPTRRLSLFRDELQALCLDYYKSTLLPQVKVKSIASVITQNKPERDEWMDGANGNGRVALNCVEFKFIISLSQFSCRILIPAWELEE